jgi:hypothetical protein
MATVILQLRCDVGLVNSHIFAKLQMLQQLLLLRNLLLSQLLPVFVNPPSISHHALFGVSTTRFSHKAPSLMHDRSLTLS